MFVRTTRDRNQLQRTVPELILISLIKLKNSRGKACPWLQITWERLRFLIFMTLLMPIKIHVLIWFFNFHIIVFSRFIFLSSYNQQNKTKQIKKAVFLSTVVLENAIDRGIIKYVGIWKSMNICTHSQLYTNKCVILSCLLLQIEYK